MELEGKSYFSRSQAENRDWFGKKSIYSKITFFFSRLHKAQMFRGEIDFF